MAVVGAGVYLPAVTRFFFTLLEKKGLLHKLVFHTVEEYSGNSSNEKLEMTPEIIDVLSKNDAGEIDLFIVLEAEMHISKPIAKFFDQYYDVPMHVVGMRNNVH